MHRDVIDLNDKLFAIKLRKTQAFLDRLVRERGYEACPDAIKALAIDTGFIKDDLESAVRYAIHTKTPRLTYRIQFNPGRGKRFAGAGRKHAPPGRTLVHDGCPLAPANIPVQQLGTELPFACELAGTPYNILAQPFPFEDVHLIAATRAHRAQEVPAQMIEQILREMLDLATWSPRFVVMINGSDGAGATIPWFHMHHFTRPAGQPFPLEALAETQIADNNPRLVVGYPLPVVVVRGPIENVIQTLSQLIRAWLADYGASATMNLMATTAGCEHGETIVYFCPRDRRNARVPGFSGAVGGLEILGEMLAYSETDKHRIDCGQINAQYVENVLRSVRAEGFERFFLSYVAKR